jgi:hypothetical protein
LNATVNNVRSRIDEGNDDHGYGDRIEPFYQGCPILMEMPAKQKIIEFLTWAFGDDPLLSDRSSSKKRHNKKRISMRSFSGPNQLMRQPECGWHWRISTRTRARCFTYRAAIAGPSTTATTSFAKSPNLKRYGRMLAQRGIPIR